MKAWLKFSEWKQWCWGGGDFDYDYFDKDKPVEVVAISEVQPYGGVVLYEVTQFQYSSSARALIPFEFISLEFYDNVMSEWYRDELGE